MAVNYIDPQKKRSEMMIRVRCLRPLNGPDRQYCDVGTVLDLPESDYRKLSPGRVERTDEKLTPPVFFGQRAKWG